MTNWKRFETVATEVLIDYFQDKLKEQSIKDDAFLAIMFRFREDLIKKCERICKGRGYDKDVARMIVEQTFVKYGKSKAFQKKEGNYESIETCFKVYLYGIASNELKNYYRQEEKRKKGLLYTGNEDIITELPPFNTATCSLESKIIHETLLGFSYSHQVVYLTYKVHQRDGVNLPKNLRLRLREHLGGISQTTVRGYKKEVTDKIESVRSIASRFNNK